MKSSIKIPPIFKKFYFITACCFLIWMLFFDSNDLLSQFKLRKRKNELANEKEFYLKRINEVKEERKALQNNNHLLEKFAREKYLMKKPSEDIYVIEDENQK